MKILLRVFRALALGVAGWALLSLFAVLPRKISCPIPAWLQTYNSRLNITGYTRENRLLEIYRERIQPVGTFDGLNLFRNNNLVNGSFVDPDTGLVHVMEDKACRVFDPEKQSSSLKKVSFGYGFFDIPLKECSIAMGPTDPRVYRSGTFVDPLATNQGYRSDWESLFSATSKEGTTYRDKDLIAAVLIRSETTEMSAQAILSLLAVAQKGTLQGWYPEENLVVLCYVKGGETTLWRGHTDQDPVLWEEYGPFEETLGMMVSSEERIFFQEDTQSIVYRNILDGSEQILMSEIDKPLQLQYCYTEKGELVVGAIFSDGRVFIDFMDHDGFLLFKLDKFFGKKIVMTGDRCILFAANDKNGYYRQGELSEWRDLEK